MEGDSGREQVSYLYFESSYRVTTLYRTDVFGYTSVEELYLMSWGGGDFDEVFEGKLPSLHGIKVIL